jgi:hypothetical protein
MPFGLTNAPATFQHFMNDVLRDCLDKFAIGILDDILVYTKTTLEDHIKHVRHVLQKLRENELYAKFSKCEFFVTQVDFLGHTVSEQGVSMCKDKHKAILDWPDLTSKDDILSFMGLANYYRRFIDNFSKLAEPITRLLKKDAPFEWQESQNKAFKAIKQAFAEDVTLSYADPEKQFQVECDASDFALGGVLSQMDDSGTIRPVSFYSRKLLPAELNYEVYDKELLAIKSCFDEWRQYLLGTALPIKVYSDHKTLEYFLATKTLTRRQARWSLFLSEFNFVIMYQKGIKNNKADALSRRHDHEITEEERKLQVKALLKPENFEQLHVATLRNQPEWTSELLLHVIREAETDKEVIGFKEKLLQTPNEMTRWSIKNNVLHFDDMVFVPQKARLEVLQQRHDAKTAGHFGFRKTLELIQREFWWPRMAKDIKHFTDSCEVCGRCKVPRHKPYGLLEPLPAATKPWSSVTMDFIVELPKSQDYNAILVVVDRMTKLSHFIPCTTNITAEETATLFINNVFKLHGLPDEIISDRGPQFKSQFWKTLFSTLEVKVKLSTAYHPQTDGQTERTNQTLEQYLRAFTNYQQDDWAELLPLAEFTYNNSYHTAIKCSPFWATYGEHPRCEVIIDEHKTSCNVPTAEERVNRMKKLHKELVTYLQETRTIMATNTNPHRLQEPTLEVGGKVWLSRKNIKTLRPCPKLDFKRLGPFEIIEKVGTKAYRLALPPLMKNLHPVFHVSLLEPVTENLLEGRTIDPPLPVEVESDIEYEVETILDSRKRRNQVSYLVSWKGYGPEENTWLNFKDLTHCQELLKEFHEKYPSKPKSFAKRQGDLGGNAGKRPRTSRHL